MQVISTSSKPQNARTSTKSRFRPLTALGMDGCDYLRRPVGLLPQTEAWVGGRARVPAGCKPHRPGCTRALLTTASTDQSFKGADGFDEFKLTSERCTRGAIRP